MTADGTPTPRTGETITTAAELDALPVGSIGVESDALIGEGWVVAFVKGRQRWHTTHPLTHPSPALPLTVLFRPDAPQPATTDEAVERAACDLLDSYPRGCDGLGCSGWDDHADRLRTALAARGDAATPTEVEWGVRYLDGEGDVDEAADDEATARARVAEMQRGYDWPEEIRLAQRTVSAWREVS